MDFSRPITCKGKLALLSNFSPSLVSTQLNAENYKNQLDDARRENAGLQQEIKDLKNDIKNLNIGLENSRKREKQAVCLRELSETPKEFKTQAMEDKCLAITK